MKDSLVQRIVSLKNLCSFQEENIRSEFVLSPAEYQGLCSLEPEMRLLCGEFSRRMNLSASRGSRVVEKLVENGFVKSTSVPGDRRAQQLSLTKKGTMLRKKIEDRKRRCEQVILTHCTGRQVQNMKKTLDTLIGILEKDGGPYGKK